MPGMGRSAFSPGQDPPQTVMVLGPLGVASVVGCLMSLSQKVESAAKNTCTVQGLCRSTKGIRITLKSEAKNLNHSNLGPRTFILNPKPQSKTEPTTAPLLLCCRSRFGWTWSQVQSLAALSKGSIPTFQRRGAWAPQ